MSVEEDINVNSLNVQEKRQIIIGIFIIINNMFDGVVVTTESLARLAHYPWLLEEIDGIKALRDVSIKRLALGQFELAKLTLNRLALTGTIFGFCTNFCTIVFVCFTHNLFCTDVKQSCELLIDIVRNGPPSDWLASPSLPTECHLSIHAIFLRDESKMGFVLLEFDNISFII
jgi:hypothetical protein